MSMHISSDPGFNPDTHALSVASCQERTSTNKPDDVGAVNSVSNFVYRCCVSTSPRFVVIDETIRVNTIKL